MKTVKGVLGNTVILKEGTSQANVKTIMQGLDSIIGDAIQAFTGQNGSNDPEHPEVRDAVRILKKAKKEVASLKSIKDKHSKMWVKNSKLAGM